MKSIHQTYRLIISLLFCYAVYPAAAEEVSLHNYSLPDHGVIHLKVPTTWKDEVRQPPNRLPPTIVFRSKGAPSFEVLLTPIWPASKDVPALTLEKIEQLVKENAKRTERQAVERHIVVKELKGPSGAGYYFTATDRAPKPGEYEYMTQGMVQLAELAITFTILTHDSQDVVIGTALEMITNAKRDK